MTTTAAGLIATSDSKYWRWRSTSENRRAFWIATPTLAAIVASRRESVFAEPAFLLDALDADDADRRVADEDRHAQVGPRRRADLPPRAPRTAATG